MKEVFFTFVAISIPVLAVGGLVYMLLHGLYRVFDDWRLDRELRQLRHQSLEQHPPGARYPPLSERELLAAFEDRPPAPESPGLAVFPLDPDWDDPLRSPPPAVDFTATATERANGAPLPETSAAELAAARQTTLEVDRPPAVNEADAGVTEIQRHTVFESARAAAHDDSTVHNDSDADAAAETLPSEAEHELQRAEGAPAADDPGAHDRSRHEPDAIARDETSSVEMEHRLKENDVAPPAERGDEPIGEAGHRPDDWPERTLD